MASLNAKGRQGDPGASIGMLRSFKPFFGLVLPSIRRRIRRIKSGHKRLASRGWRPIVSRLNRRRQLSHELGQKFHRPGALSLKQPETRRDLGWRRLDMVLPSGVPLHSVSLRPELALPAGQIVQPFKRAEPESSRRQPALPEERRKPPADFRKPEPRARLYSKIEEISKREVAPQKPAKARDRVEGRIPKTSPEIQPAAKPKPTARETVRPVTPPESFPQIEPRPAVSEESTFADTELDKPLVQPQPRFDAEGLLPAKKPEPGLGEEAGRVSEHLQRKLPVVARPFKPISSGKSKPVQRSIKPAWKTVHERMRRKTVPEPASAPMDTIVQKVGQPIRHDWLQKPVSRFAIPTAPHPPIQPAVVTKDARPVEERIEKVSSELESFLAPSKANREQLRAAGISGIQRMPLGTTELSRKTQEGLGKQALPEAEKPKVKEKLPSTKELAQMVYPLIKRMLAVEKERSSGRPF